MLNVFGKEDVVLVALVIFLDFMRGINLPFPIGHKLRWRQRWGVQAALNLLHAGVTRAQGMNAKAHVHTL